ncbi:hypothetical protein RhiJN_06601 [Ceratobasidium sp. AG-Ba]|nr:hypothetical protein RhiJN_06601 [Ceratobasidium sp. AG-Ba]
MHPGSLAEPPPADPPSPMLPVNSGPTEDFAPPSDITDFALYRYGGIVVPNHSDTIHDAGIGSSLVTEKIHTSVPSSLDAINWVNAYDNSERPASRPLSGVHKEVDPRANVSICRATNPGTLSLVDNLGVQPQDDYIQSIQENSNYVYQQPGNTAPIIPGSAGPSPCTESAIPYTFTEVPNYEPGPHNPLYRTWVQQNFSPTRLTTITYSLGSPRHKR